MVRLTLPVKNGTMLIVGLTQADLDALATGAMVNTTLDMETVRVCTELSIMFKPTQEELLDEIAGVIGPGTEINGRSGVQPPPREGDDQ